jgi:hypothetical protein
MGLPVQSNWSARLQNVQPERWQHSFRKFYSNLQERFGLIIQDAVPLGLNPKFIDIARGPSGRTYLTQAIRFLEAYKQAAYTNVLSDVSMNAAYNTAAMRVGTSSPLIPSRTLMKNVISRLGINGVDRLISFYGEVLSAL